VRDFKAIIVGAEAWCQPDQASLDELFEYAIDPVRFGQLH